MRLKHIPGSEDDVAASLFTISEPAAKIGNWKSSVSDGKDIFLEIGCGKGQFLHETARQNRNVFCIGCDRYASVLIKAIRKVENDPLPNISFICGNAEDLPEYFSFGEIDRIFLNFSDPWPKKRHAKRRLTSHEHLDMYSQLLLPGNTIEFKTDNSELFQFSLEEIDTHPRFRITEKTFDLHNDPEMSDGNIMTEYEEKFSSQGHPIFKLIAEVLPAE